MPSEFNGTAIWCRTEQREEWRAGKSVDLPRQGPHELVSGMASVVLPRILVVGPRTHPFQHASWGPDVQPCLELLTGNVFTGTGKKGTREVWI